MEQTLNAGVPPEPTRRRSDASDAYADEHRANRQTDMTSPIALPSSPSPVGSPARGGPRPVLGERRGRSRCSREVPAGRWMLPPERCTDPRIANPDTVYSTRGYYLDPFEPGLAGLDLDPALVARTRPALSPRPRRRQPGVARREDGADRPLARRRRPRQHLPADRPVERPVPRRFSASKLGSAEASNADASAEPLRRRAAGRACWRRAWARRRQLHARRRVRVVAVRDQARGRRTARRPGRRDARGRLSRPDCQYTQMGFAQLRALLAVGPLLAVRCQRPTGSWSARGRACSC